MLAFTAAVFLLLITPGPGVLSTAGVGAAFGYRPGFRYVLGLFVGTNLVAIAVVTGVAAVVLASPLIRSILLLVSSCYLLYLASRIAFAGSKISFIEAKSRPGIVAGIVLQLFNPKAYVVNTALFTGFAFMPTALAFETLVKFIIINAIWVPIHLLWLYGGSSLHKLNLSLIIQRRINVAMALGLATVVILALYSL